MIMISNSTVHKTIGKPTNNNNKYVNSTQDHFYSRKMLPKSPHLFKEGTTTPRSEPRKRRIEIKNSNPSNGQKRSTLFIFASLNSHGLSGLLSGESMCWQNDNKKITTWTSLSQTQRDPKKKKTNLSNIQAFRGGSRSWGPWTRIWRRQRAKRAGRRKRDERSSKWTMWKMKSEKNPLTASEGRSARRISKRRLVARRAAGENMVGDPEPGTNEVIRETQRDQEPRRK